MEPRPIKPEKSATSRRRAAGINMILGYSNVVFNIVNGFLLVPLYLREFSLSTYGAWLASGNILRMISALDGGMTLVFSQRLGLAHGQGDYRTFGRYVGSGLLIYTGIALLITITGISIAPYVPGWVNAEKSSYGPLRWAVTLASGGAGFTLMQENIFVIPRAWQQPLWPGLIRIFCIIINVATILIGLTLGWGVLSLGLGACVAGAVGVVLAAIYVSGSWVAARLPRPTIDRPALIDLVSTSAHLIASRIANALLGQAESFVVAVVINPAAAAVLSITTRAFQLAEAVANPVATAVYSSLAHLLGEQGLGRVKSVLVEVFSVSALLTALAVSGALVLNESFVSLWVGSEKFGGQVVNILVAVNAVIVIRLSLLGMIVPALGELKAAAWCSVIEVFVRLPLMYLLAHSFGILGMPLASIASSLLVSFPYLFWLMGRGLNSRLKHTSGIHLAGMGSIVLCFLAALAIQRFYPAPSTWLLWSIFVVLSSVVLFLLAYVGTPEPMRAGYKFMRNRLIRA